jgi:hypothetical protein
MSCGFGGCYPYGWRGYGYPGWGPWRGYGYPGYYGRIGFPYQRGYGWYGSRRGFW